MNWMYGMNTTLGTRISQLRQDRGWTQKELAAKAEITQNHVSRIEKDRMQPRRSTLTGIAHAFGIEVEDLEALVQVPDKNIEERIAKDDPDLAALISQIPLLSSDQKDALRVTLRSMIAYQKVRQVTGAAS
jgi:transcriptional regulator with XRE-family HTH domain